MGFLSRAIIFAAVVFASSVSAHAPRGIRRADATLKFQSRTGARGEYVLRLANHILRVNEEVVPTDQWVALLPNVQTLLVVLATARLVRCEAGTFEHRVVQGTRIQSAVGCMEDARFATLVENFRALQ